MTNKRAVKADDGGGLTIPAPRRIRPIKLDTLAHVKSELGRVYRAMRCGEISPADGTKLAFVLDRIASVISTAELEARIDAIEGEFSVKDRT